MGEALAKEERPLQQIREEPRTGRRHGVAAVPLALAVLVAGVAGSLVAADAWRARTAAEDAVRFEQEVRLARTTLVDELRRYEDALVSAAGLFAASERVSARDFAGFAEALSLRAGHPAAEGIAYVSRRRDGRYVTAYAEPRESWTSAGLDLSRFRRTREALDAARDGGRATLTERYAPPRDRRLGAAPRRAGFTLFLPLYRDGRHPSTVAARRAALHGFLGIRFPGARMLRGALGSRASEVRVELYDGAQAAGAKNLVAASPPAGDSPREGDGARLERELRLPLYGATWLLRARALEGFGRESSHDAPVLILVAGLLLSALLAALVWTLGRGRARALRLVDAALARVRAGEERFRSLAASPIGIFHTDADGRLLYVNSRWREICGGERQDFQGMPWTEIARQAERESLRRAWRAVAKGGREFAWELRIDRGGESGDRWVLCRVAALSDGGGEASGYVGSLEDVSERKVFEAELARRALHDPLTGLPNRTLFLDRLSLALARAGRESSTVAVFFVDLDRFKVINDSLGHALGDRLLVTVARRLTRALRASDTVARFGGDEFTVLSPDVSDEREAVRVAERIAAAIAAPYGLDGREVFTTASIGIALAEDGNADTPETLLRDADAAMYRAKECGRARHELFDEGLRTRVVRELDTESDLRRALERGEFRLYYQPSVDLANGEIVGLEALIRWYHPEHGVVAPGDFIPLAEETGLIAPIGAWVLGEACRQAQDWRRTLGTAAPSVAVNLSARQLADPRLADAVKGTLLEAGADPGLVSLEITETVLMDDAESSVITLRALKELGVGLALDDFGTGYSSLSYLKRFPIDALKLDRAFVSGLGRSADDMAIAGAIVGMAGALGLKVVAEGVETAEQLAELRALGCDRAQGYYFAPPQPAETVVELLEREPWWVLAERLPG